MRIIVFWNVACVLVMMGQSGTQAVSQETKFRAGVDVVRVDVSVLNRDRSPVADLGPGDFVIHADGTVRPVVAFAKVSVGPDAVDGPPTANTALDAGVATSPGEPVDRGRLVAILFDRTIPSGDSTIVARQVATAFVNNLGPDDYAAILRSSGFAGEGKSREFTKDRKVLLAAIASPFMGMTSPPAMTMGGLVEGARIQNSGECLCGSCSLDAIAAVAHAIQADLGRRKMLVFIGSDLPFLSQDRQCSILLKDARERMFRELDLSNLTVHVLDPSGLEAGGVPAGSLVRQSGQVVPFVASKAQDRQVRQGNLAVLPERTGGRLVTSTNRPEVFAAQVLEESRTYYLLGFQPVSSSADGKVHRIDVKVARSGVRVIARKSYVVPQTSR